MDIETQLDNYANLIVKYGLNVQAGQLVNIGAEAIHKDFVLRVAKLAYMAGASFVNVDLADIRLTRLRVLYSDEANLGFVPRFYNTKYNDMVEECSANLKILGSEDPDILLGLDPKKINDVRRGFYESAKHFYAEGVGKSRVHWTIAGAATPVWAKKVFPDLAQDEAYDRLWSYILKTCRADSENCISDWVEHDAKLHKRATMLNELRISNLHFVGPGTDLYVGLTDKAIFKGGRDISPRGVVFEPNLPTEEVFTTPDWRMTNGKVKATRPFLINGTLIKDWIGEFKDGELVSFDTSNGRAVFEEYINSDAGGRRLGEVALVGVDSPVYQSGVVFQEILYDENAACHFAIGSAYKFCLQNGEDITASEVDSLGCNESSIHTDIMISDGCTNVTAKTLNGQAIQLIENGRWFV